MSTYILIHGAWHGGWCWDKVVPLLKGKGHKVEAPDLPGHGDDKTPISDISLQAYTDKVCGISDHHGEPVILVGHSMAGAVITQVAEKRPESIKKLVYIAALLVQNGENIHQYTSSPENDFPPSILIFSEDQSYNTINDNALKDLLYGDCSDQDIEWARSRLVPQATVVFTTPVHHTAANFGRIPRVYITCLRDNCIKPLIQEKMLNNLPCEKVIKMDTCHVPMFSAPEELATHLANL